MTSKSLSRDVPGGPVVRNLLDNAGDVDSIPGRGTKIPHEAQQVSQGITARESTCLDRRYHKTK